MVCAELGSYVYLHVHTIRAMSVCRYIVHECMRKFVRNVYAHSICRLCLFYRRRPNKIIVTLLLPDIYSKSTL